MSDSNCRFGTFPAPPVPRAPHELILREDPVVAPWSNATAARPAAPDRRSVRPIYAGGSVRALLPDPLDVDGKAVSDRPNTAAAPAVRTIDFNAPYPDRASPGSFPRS